MRFVLAACLTLLACAAPAAASERVLTGTLERLEGHGAGDAWVLERSRADRTALRLPGRAAPAGARVRVRGRMRGGALRVSSLERLPGARARTAGARGARRVALVLFGFSNRPAAWTRAQGRAAVFDGRGSVAGYYAAASHGRLRLSGDVVGPVTLPERAGRCTDASITRWTARAARLAGGLDAYDQVVFAHPKLDCPWAGIAQLGGWWSAFNGTLDLWVAGHEIGHNYGLEHAGKRYCGAVPQAASCAVQEYDDPYDFMGNRRPVRRPHAIHQLQAGWMPAANLRTATGGTETVTLAPAAEHRPRATQALRLPAGPGRWYYVEHRGRLAPFDDFAVGDPLLAGVTIRVAGDVRAPGVSELLDFTPGTRWTARDEPLAAGRLWDDPVTGARVEVLAAGADGATVRVTTGGSGGRAEPAPAGPASSSPIASSPRRRAGAGTRPARPPRLRARGAQPGGRRGRARPGPGA